MDWELVDRAKKCERCGKEFSPGENYNSYLFLEKGKLISKFPAKDNVEATNSEANVLKNTGYRVELCPQCTEIVTEKEYDGFWQGHIKDKKEQKNDSNIIKLNKEDILNILREHIQDALNSQNEEEKIEKNGVAYFLAVMLERKNVIQFKKDCISDETGIRIALYEQGKTGESFQIPYPLLSSENIAHYQEKIFGLLGINPKKKKEKLSE